MAIRTYQDDCGMTVRTIQKDDHLALAILKNLGRFALVLAFMAAFGVVWVVLDELWTWWEYNGFIQIIIGK